MQGKLKPSSKMLENVAGQKVKADEIATVKVGFERPNGVSESKPSLIGFANNGNSTALASK